MTRNELYDAWYKAHRDRFELGRFDGMGDYQANAHRLVHTWRRRLSWVGVSVWTRR